MDTNTLGRSPDARVARIAGRYSGVVSRDQLLAAGLSPDAIKRRLRSRRLHRLHRNVYLVGHTHLDWHARAYAALLAVGTGAGLSGLSGAGHRGWLERHTGPIHVTTARRSGHGTPGIAIHRVRRMPPVERVKGLPVLTAEHLLLDLAVSQSAPTLQRALNQAAYDRAVDLDAVRRLVATRRKGGPALREALAMCAPTRSYLEDRFYRFFRRAELPPPLANWKVGDYQVDFLWPDHGVVVETDGWAGHGQAVGRTRDRRKTLYLQGLGLAVMRLPGRRLKSSALAAIAELSGVLAVAALNPTRIAVER